MPSNIYQRVATLSTQIFALINQFALSFMRTFVIKSMAWVTKYVCRYDNLSTHIISIIKGCADETDDLEIIFGEVT